MQLTLTYNIDGSQTYDFEQECMVNKSDEVRQLSWDEQTILMPIHDGAHTLTICCNDPNFNIEAVPPDALFRPLSQIDLAPSIRHLSLSLCAH